jgi:hypothetical protein
MAIPRNNTVRIATPAGSTWLVALAGGNAGIEMSLIGPLPHDLPQLSLASNASNGINPSVDSGESAPKLPPGLHSGSFPRV